MAKKLFLSILLGMLASALKTFGIPIGFDVKTYTQTLDHFNYGPKSSTTFPQRYVIKSNHWGGASTNSPIFYYLGDELTLDTNLDAGFIIENAQRFKALLVFVEHRYYGESFPFGSEEEAFRNSSTLQYLNSEQALADYAQFLGDLKKNLSAENCPVIAVGASYGGMLAAWFRLKYPHMVMGALASSAAILSFDNLTPQDSYYLIATKTYKETSKHCYETIKSSWSEIDKVANQVNGLATLSQVLNSCSPVSNADDVKSTLQMLYFNFAQYETPKRKFVKLMCDGIDKEASNNVLRKIASGLNSSVGPSCNGFGSLRNFTLAQLGGWSWQTCTELITPKGVLERNTMFEVSPFDFKKVSQRCAELYVDAPIRPHWITMEFGGQNIKKVLENFGSNIIFSNGLRDPYSSAGILQNISNSIVAVVTEEGSHYLDIWASDDSDPEWLISQRKAEMEILQNWIEEYNAK